MRATWRSNIGFLLSAAGSAVGLGNIWKFPYITGQNGGGLFVVFYLLCIIAIAMPVMIAEITIGQMAKSDAVNSFSKILKRPTPWCLAGVLGLISTILIMSFYSVIAAWILYFLKTSLFQFELFASPDSVASIFSTIQEDWHQLLMYQALFFAMTVYAVAGGVNKGIEALNSFLLPLLVLILVLLTGYAMTLPGFSQAFSFLFSFEAKDFSMHGMIEAVGHSFFTVSVGVGIMITYGSYLKDRKNLSRITLTIVIADTCIALVSGLVIFSIVFTHGCKPSQGPLLIFQTLPLLFGNMWGGYYVSMLFFFLVLFTAITSSVSLLEVPVASLEEKGYSRKKSIGYLLALESILAIVCALSFSTLQDFKLWDMTTFDIFDAMTSKIFLPLSGLLCILFYAKHIYSKKLQEELFSMAWQRSLFSFCVRFLAPFAIITILVVGWMSGGSETPKAAEEELPKHAACHHRTD